MLEIDFNELDNDFITIWSRKLLGYSIRSIYDDIRKLAELGQVNAVQSYYLLKNDDIHNNIIDEHIKKAGENIGKTDYNWDIAFSHSLESEDKYYEYVVYLLDRKNEFKESTEYLLDNGNIMTGYDFLMSHKSSKISYNASQLLMQLYERSKNPLFLERAIEIREGLLLHIPMKLKVKNQLELAKLYKNNSQNPQIAYAFGKSLFFRGNANNQKILGTQILSNFASREFSDTLKSYNENHDEFNNNNTETQDDSISRIFKEINSHEKETGKKFSYLNSDNDNENIE